MGLTLTVFIMHLGTVVMLFPILIGIEKVTRQKVIKAEKAII